MKKLFKVLGILMLCIFGITHREKVCVVTVKCYNNLKDNMGMPFINVFLICILYCYTLFNCSILVY